MTRAEQFAELKGFRKGAPHPLKVDEYFWEEGEGYWTTIAKKSGYFNPADCKLENSFIYGIKSEQSPNGESLMRYEFEDGSAIVFRERGWAFGFSADEIADPDICLRWQRNPAVELPIEYTDRKTVPLN
ncbi:MAG: hypothetical protein OXE94_10390 [Aestuariivita sp.]|nr:hypothetical protein [Aestuariivita sp.]MCY4203517.1 hypothetical protein [Aestuariivita sp.]